MKGKTVTIDAATYLDLLVADEKLSRLECAGVDNWQGYSSIYGEEEDGSDDLDLWTESTKIDILNMVNEK